MLCSSSYPSNRHTCAHVHKRRGRSQPLLHTSRCGPGASRATQRACLPCCPEQRTNRWVPTGSSPRARVAGSSSSWARWAAEQGRVQNPAREARRGCVRMGYSPEGVWRRGAERAHRRCMACIGLATCVVMCRRRVPLFIWLRTGFSCSSGRCALFCAELEALMTGC